MRKRSASDDELMQAVADGDTAAFSELMRRHQRWIGSLVRAFIRDRQQAEDITQEVFCRVHRHAGDYVARDQFVAWIKRIAINLAKDCLRRERVSPVPLEALEEGAAGIHPFDPATAILSDALRDDLRTAIQALPDEQRLVLIMRYFGDMSVQDIAWAVKSPEGTVKSRLFHGLRRVRQTLTEIWEQEGER
jgi:RNA polymerase sigma-70 factor (ECF subfamily)